MSVLASYIVPHAPILIEMIGDNQMQLAIKTVQAMEKIAKEIVALEPDALVVISPHGPIFNDAIAVYDLNRYSGDFEAFVKPSPSYSFTKDQVFIETLLSINATKKGVYYPLKDNDFEAFQFSPTLDHGILVPLHFLWDAGLNVPITCMSYGTLSYETLMENAALLKETSEKIQKNVVIIASGDLSHTLMACGPCEYHESGEKLDHFIVQAIANNKPYDMFFVPEQWVEDGKPCGLQSFAMGIGVFGDEGLSTKLYSYEGPFGVGYMVANVIPSEERTMGFQYFKNKRQSEWRDQIEKEHFYVKIARLAMAYYLENQRLPQVEVTETAVTIGTHHVMVPYDVFLEDLEALQSTFVSVKYKGTLRGCMGDTESKWTLLESIIENAVNACAFDTRFEGLTLEALDDTLIYVDVLSPLERIDSVDQLNPELYGVLIKGKGRSGLLLPALEGIHTVAEQLKIAQNKAGLETQTTEEMYRFTVQRYK